MISIGFAINTWIWKIAQLRQLWKVEIFDMVQVTQKHDYQDAKGTDFGTEKTGERFLYICSSSSSLVVLSLSLSLSLSLLSLLSLTLMYLIENFNKRIITNSVTIITNYIHVYIYMRAAKSGTAGQQHLTSCYQTLYGSPFDVLGSFLARTAALNSLPLKAFVGGH